MPAENLTVPQIQAALKLGKDNGLVIIPTKRKIPQCSGWQKFKKSYVDDAWNHSTGFGIVTGENSKITVIDVDDDMEWFSAFWDKYDLDPTTCVVTPSGGMHLYFKWDARLKQTQGFNGLSIDVRNDGGYIMAPGSSYDVDPQSKKAEHIGKLYTFDKDGEGNELDWSHMRTLDEIFVKMQFYGMDRETMELLPEKEIVKEQITKDVTNGRTAITNVDHFMEYVASLGVRHGANGAWYGVWRNICWCICAVAHENNWDAEKLVLEFSRGCPGYNGDEYALKVVSQFDLEKAKKCNTGLPLLLSSKYVERSDPARVRFLKHFRKEYFFNDYVKILSRAAQNDGIVKLQEVHDFLSTAMVKVIRAGTPSWYLRGRQKKTVVWEIYKQQGNPFKVDNHGNFDYFREKTPQEIAKEVAARDKANAKSSKSLPPIKKFARERSSFYNQLLDHQFAKIETYDNIVFRPYFGAAPPCSDNIFNTFQGYRHRPFPTDVQKKWLDDEDFIFMMNHWKETMCDSDPEMFEYVMNWCSYLLQFGYKKIRTFLVFIGAQRIGKNTMWEHLFINGIVGSQYGQVVDSLTEFQTNFNSLRLNKIFTMFNECTALNRATKGRATNWDRIKALVDPQFRCEYKGKEAFMAEDPSGYVFCSNHKHSVFLDNDDHRFVITSMDSKHQGKTVYFTRLNAIVRNTNIQRAFFTYLINRDVTEWDQSKFPKTKLRMEIIENKSFNVVFKYFINVVTEKNWKWGEWYQPELDETENDAIPKCWYAIDGPNDERMFKMYQDWSNHIGCKTSCNRIHFKQKLKAAGLEENRVTDRSFGLPGKQVQCLKVTKAAVKRMMIKVTNDDKWDFASLVKNPS